MNILDANKIKKNPNIIDEMEDSKLTDEIVSYAIDKGYKINKATLAKLARFKAYVSHFRNTEEMLNYQIQLAKQNEGLSVLFAFCESDRDRFTNILIKDNDLIKIAIYKDYLHMLGESNIIKIVKAKPQFMDDILSKYQDPKEEFRKVVVSFQNPTDLLNLNVLEKYEETFLLASSAGKITELLIIFNRFGEYDKLEKYSHLLANQIENNIPSFLWDIKLIDRIYDYDFLKTNPSIEEKTMQYLKENHIMFSYNLPDFVLQDEEYIMQCIKDNPKIVSSLPEKFSKNNVDVIIECLKNDYMSFSDNRHTFTMEEYSRIYNETKEYIQTEDILKNNFLLQNPYVLKDLLSQGIKIEDYKIRDTAYYDKEYEEIKRIADEKGISIPKPDDYYKMVIQEDDKVIVRASKIENIKRGLEYIEEYGILGNLIVELRQGYFDEFLITDNLDFFKHLQDNNINLNFKYNSSKRLFKLSKVIEDEETMNMVTESIKEYNFSPLEQVIAVFDIVKNFKAYNKSDNSDISAPRAFFEYLNNNYMVCAGYSDLFVNLGHRLNAQYAFIGLKIKDHKKNTVAAHARNYANIVDYKYGIDGYYVIEATWENMRAELQSRFEEKRSTYNGLMLTTDEGRNYTFPNSEILLDDEGIDGRYDRWLTFDNAEQLKEYLLDPETKTEDIWKSKEIKRFIRYMSPELYKEIANKQLSDNANCEILVNYFKSKVNKKIPTDKLLDAIMEVKKKIYINLTEQDIEDMKMAYSMTDRFKNDDESDSRCNREDEFNNYLSMKTKSYGIITKQKNTEEEETR